MFTSLPSAKHLAIAAVVAILLVAGLFINQARADDAQNVATDRAALVALYNFTDGANWSNNTNWLSDQPLGNWHGVDTDASGRVTSLILSRNGLTGSIPNELGSLSSLTELNFADNQLTGTIPAQLGSLSNLTKLELHNNQLTGNIPTQVGSLSDLTVLELADNQLTGSIPREVGHITQEPWVQLH